MWFFEVSVYDDDEVFWEFVGESFEFVCVFNGGGGVVDGVWVDND